MRVEVCAEGLWGYGIIAKWVAGRGGGTRKYVLQSLSLPYQCRIATDLISVYQDLSMLIICVHVLT